jgi:hypothetical protein
MPDKYTHDELTKRVKSPGWRLVTGKKRRQDGYGHARTCLDVTHERRKRGKAPGVMEEIEKRSNWK